MEKIFLDINGILAAAVCAVILIIIQLVQSMLKIAIEPPKAFIVLVICVPCMSMMLTLPTVVAPTFVAIIALITMTITSGVLLLLTCTSFNFNSWGMYALVPGLGLAVLGALLGAISSLLEVKYRTLELAIVIILMVINLFIYVYLLQTVLSGNFEEHGDAIYVYAATMLYTTIVLVLVIYVKYCGRKRRRRRRLF